MKLWMRLLLCAWLAACGSGPAPSGPAPAPTSGAVPMRTPAIMPVSVPTPCVRPAHERSFEYALLRTGCDNRLEPGRATWTVTGDTVVLEFPAGSEGPMGAELVAAWPPLDQPPWLGHRVNRLAVLAGGNVRVEFAEPVRDPARLFVDPRLAGVPRQVEEGDVRDAIDADGRGIVTRHDASIEYARSLGRNVQLAAYDRLYLVAFAGSTEAAAAEALRTGVGMGWIARGAALARRLLSLRWDTVAEMCGSGPVGAVGGPVGDSLGADASTVRAPPAVSYPEDDPAARQIAERVVSAGLPGGPFAATVAELTGSRARMVVRPVPPGGDRWSPAEAAAVIAVPSGPVHPCSLYAEVLAHLDGWEGGPERAIPTVLVIGETASFAIETSSARHRQ